MSDEEYDSENDLSDNNSADSFDASLYLKITDFGVAHPIAMGSQKAYMKYKCGTYYYTAPEISNVNYRNFLNDSNFEFYLKIRLKFY